jgi:hypothetical protein
MSPEMAAADIPGVQLAQAANPGASQPDAPPPTKPPGTPAPTAAPGNAPGGPPPPGAPGGPPPIPVLLGIADFLTLIERAFDAEDIYRGVLAMDPKNEQALAGLRRARAAQEPTVTFLWHQYTDSHDVRLRAWGGGPTFRTRYGNITITAGTGHYRNDNDPTNLRNPLGPIASPVDDRRLRKDTLNLLLEPHYKRYEGRWFVSRVNYDTAPDRTLYDLRFSYVLVPNRHLYSVTVAQRDSILQSAQAEFFGPESFYTVVSRLLIDEVGVAMQYPLRLRWDLGASFSRYDYSDGNERDTFKANLMYRLRPKGREQMPVFRIGLGYISDDTERFAPIYYSPQSIQSLSVLADYVMIRRGLQFGLFAGYPIWDDSGIGFAEHEPAKTLFGFVRYDLSDRYQVYLNGGTIDSPGFDLSFTDIVLGINGRF